MSCNLEAILLGLFFKLYFNSSYHLPNLREKKKIREILILPNRAEGKNENYTKKKIDFSKKK